MAQFIGLEVENVDKIYEALAELPAELIDEGADAVLDYWRGALRNPANYARYQYVSRAQAYPDSVNDPRWNTPLPSGKLHTPVPGYFSPAQFRYVMAAIKDGRMTPGTPNRTGTLAKGWQKAGSGTEGFLYNDTEYASYVIGDGTQSRHEGLVGWLTAGVFVNLPRLVQGASKALEAAVVKILKRKKL